jgi:hypothetical protein
MDKVNQNRLPGSIEDFDFSTHPTPTALKITATKKKADKQSSKKKDTTYRLYLREEQIRN